STIRRGLLLLNNSDVIKGFFQFIHIERTPS
ncbi:hypothetical protein L916_21520, partial [Phytophthora nicotianae]